MREIKFRAWNGKRIINWEELGELWIDILKGYTQFIPMQFTGLKDKNNKTFIYEGDFIDVDGNIRGNIYENKEIYKNGANYLLITMEAKEWGSTISKAIRLGCKFTE